MEGGGGGVVVWGVLFFFFFNDTATTEIYTLSLHDALPIYRDASVRSFLVPKPSLGPNLELTLRLEFVMPVVKFCDLK